MATKKFKKDEVTLSFHYLKRERAPKEGEKQVEIPFTKKEFADLAKSLRALTKLNLKDDKVDVKVRSKTLVPILKVEGPEEQFIYGRYHGVYHGHAYNNLDKGKIPAHSLNLRPFFFMLFLSESGRIYICSQYLGNYGSYTALKQTIMRQIDDYVGITSYSFNRGSLFFENVEPKEIEISYSKAPDANGKKNKYGSRGAITIQRIDGDENFEKAGQKLLAKGNAAKGKKPDAELRKILSNMLRERELLELSDDEIKDCNILAKVDKRTRTYQIFDDSTFATRFPIKVTFNTDGHPMYDSVKAKAKILIEEQIISVKEDL